MRHDRLGDWKDNKTQRQDWERLDTEGHSHNRNKTYKQQTQTQHIQELKHNYLIFSKEQNSERTVTVPWTGHCFTNSDVNKSNKKVILVRRYQKNFGKILHFMLSLVVKVFHIFFKSSPGTIQISFFFCELEINK